MILFRLKPHLHCCLLLGSLQDIFPDASGLHHLCHLSPHPGGGEQLWAFGGLMAVVINLVIRLRRQGMQTSRNTSMDDARLL